MVPPVVCSTARSSHMPRAFKCVLLLLTGDVVFDWKHMNVSLHMHVSNYGLGKKLAGFTYCLGSWAP